MLGELSRSAVVCAPQATSPGGTCLVTTEYGSVRTLPRPDRRWRWGAEVDEPLWMVLTGCSCSHLPCVGSREAARECRRKKKEYVKCLENRVAVLENQNKTLIEELKALKDLYCHKAE